MEEQITPCKYISQNCPNYSPDSHTCNHGGGSYCGKFRQFEETKYKKLLLLSKTGIAIAVLIFCAVGALLVYLIYHSTAMYETFCLVIIFAGWLIKVFQNIERCKNVL
jgi:hypothetical protein